MPAWLEVGAGLLSYLPAGPAHWIILWSLTSGGVCGEGRSSSLILAANSLIIHLTQAPKTTLVCKWQIKRGGGAGKAFVPVLSDIKSDGSTEILLKVKAEQGLQHGLMYLMSILKILNA